MLDLSSGLVLLLALEQKRSEAMRALRNLSFRLPDGLCEAVDVQPTEEHRGFTTRPRPLGGLCLCEESFQFSQWQRHEDRSAPKQTANWHSEDDVRYSDPKSLLVNIVLSDESKE